jgi:sugar/nucleoside kinase (ribokinase family)
VTAPEPHAGGRPMVEALDALFADRGVTRLEVERELLPGVDRWLTHVMTGKHLLREDRLELVLQWAGVGSRDYYKLKLADIRSQIGFGTPRDAHQGLARSVTIAGIGATNYDVILPLSRSARRDLAVRSFTSQPEKALGSDYEFRREVDELRRKLGPDAAKRLFNEYGGSTFNMMRVCAMAQTGIQLGFVGVSGTPPASSGLGLHRDLFIDLGVDCTFLPAMRDVPAGRCLSIVRARGDEVQREMATFEGGNHRLFGHLVENFWAIVGYLSQARAIHVTSVFDDWSPSVMALALGEVVRRNPDVLVSFDPGHVWASQADESVATILQLTSLLFVTEEELGLMANTYTSRRLAADEEPDHAAAILGMMRRRDKSLVVVKHKGATSIYEPGRAPLHSALDELAKDVEDDTGAGDAFAAGYLLMTLLDAGPTTAAQVGLEIARAKLAQVGPPSALLIQEILRRHLPPVDPDRPIPDGSLSRKHIGSAAAGPNRHAMDG